MCNVVKNYTGGNDPSNSETLMGDSILGLEKVSASGTTILALHDSGSSHQLLDRSCKHLCTNVKKVRVKLSVVDQSKFLWVESGILTLNMVSKGQSKKLNLEVYLINLNMDRYRSIKIKTPVSWCKSYTLPSEWVSQEGAPQLILGNSFLHRYPHVIISNYKGLTLNQSSITGKLFIQGSSDGHQLEEDLKEETSNVPVIKSSKAILCKVDQDFFRYNYLEELPVTSQCSDCSLQKCHRCEGELFTKNDSQRQQDAVISKLIKFIPEKQYVMAKLPFNDRKSQLQTHLHSNIKLFHQFEKK